MAKRKTTEKSTETKSTTVGCEAQHRQLVFDGEQLTELMERLGLNWKERRLAELALMEDLVPLLKKRAAGRDISGLGAYEQ